MTARRTAKVSAAVRAWLEDVTLTMRTPMPDEGPLRWPIAVPPPGRGLWMGAWQSALDRAAWPTEYGGGGLSRDQNRVLQRAGRINARPARSFGLMMLGPALRSSWTTKALPRSSKAKSGGAGVTANRVGSDQPAATPVPKIWATTTRVNGSKIWTSANRTDWINYLVRMSQGTPKHQGISFLLFDMSGCQHEADQTHRGASPFCQTFFDNVKVQTQLVGELNKGWTITKRLPCRRASIASMGERPGRNTETLHDWRNATWANPTVGLPTLSARPNRGTRDVGARLRDNAPGSRRGKSRYGGWRRLVNVQVLRYRPTGQIRPDAGGDGLTKPQVGRRCVRRRGALHNAVLITFSSELNRRRYQRSAATSLPSACWDCLIKHLVEEQTVIQNQNNGEATWHWS